MDIQSEPAYTEETVTDLEFYFVGGTVESLTLREGDSCVNNLDAVTITFGSAGRIPGTIDIFKRNLLWAGEHKRVEKRLVSATTQSPGQ